MAQRMNLLGEPGVGLSGGSGKPSPSRAEIRVDSVLVWGLIALTIFAVIGQVVNWYQSRDVVTGAHGPFPAAFASEAPVAPGHVLRRTTYDVTLVHGLSIQRTDSGVRAVNLRTGKEYWRYERGDKDSIGKEFAVSERTVVIAYWDSRLVGVDLRTGHPLWHVKIRHGKDDYRNVRLVGGQVITEAPGAVRAFAERDGRALWTAKMPKSCPDVFVQTVYALPDHLSVIPVFCTGISRDSDGYYPLLGVDNRTGKILWQQHSVDETLMVKGDEHTLVVPVTDAGNTPTVQLLDMSRHGTTVRARISTKVWDAVAAGGGAVLSGTDPKGSKDHDTLLSAYHTQGGHFAWQLRAPAGQEYGFPKIADGRVYVVRQALLTLADSGARISADLLVLDASTGRLLHTLHLPAVTAPDGYENDSGLKLDVREIADGAVSIGWREDSGGDLIVTN